MSIPVAPSTSNAPRGGTVLPVSSAVHAWWRAATQPLRGRTIRAAAADAARETSEPPHRSGSSYPGAFGVVARFGAAREKHEWRKPPVKQTAMGDDQVLSDGDRVSQGGSGTAVRIGRNRRR